MFLIYRNSFCKNRQKCIYAKFRSLIIIDEQVMQFTVLSLFGVALNLTAYSYYYPVAHTLVL